MRERPSLGSLPNFCTLSSHVAKRSAAIFGLSGFGGNTLQQHLPCRKKNNAWEPAASSDSTRTYRPLPEPVRPNTVTRTELRKLGANHFSTCERRDCAFVAFMGCSIKNCKREKRRYRYAIRINRRLINRHSRYAGSSTFRSTRSKWKSRIAAVSSLTMSGCQLPSANLSLPY